MVINTLKSAFLLYVALYKSLCSAKATPDVRCQEVSNEFMLRSEITCASVLGIGIHNGKCKTISGCGARGHEFFFTKEECESTCRSNNLHTPTPMNPAPTLTR